MLFATYQLSGRVADCVSQLSWQMKVTGETIDRCRLAKWALMGEIEPGEAWLGENGEKIRMRRGWLR